MKQTLAVISNYHEVCGISDYTERIEPELRNYYEVTIFPIDTDILKSTDKRMIKTGDRLIKQIAEDIKQFDLVNIQFEAGLYGVYPDIVKKRITYLIRNSKNIIFTFHSVKLEAPSPQKRNLFSKNFWNEITSYVGKKHMFDLYDTIIKEIKKLDASSEKKGNIIVHDRKSKSFIENAYGFQHVYCHPLGLLNKAGRDKVYSEQERIEFRKQYKIAEHEKVIGLFGFVSEYKGHMTAIKALDYLPDEYVILIFGEQHPASIQAFSPIDGYLNSIIQYIEKHDATYSVKDKSKGQATYRKRRPLSERIQFVGGVNNDEFSRAMRYCDYVSLPHMEVGQMGSGVASLAIESHARLIISNTKCFQLLSENFPGCFETFDIGNHMQLARKILTYDDNHNEAINRALQEHNLEKNVEKYRSIFQREK